MTAYEQWLKELPNDELERETRAKISGHFSRDVNEKTANRQYMLVKLCCEECVRRGIDYVPWCKQIKEQKIAQRKGVGS